MSQVMMPLMGAVSTQWTQRANDRAGSSIFDGSSQVISLPGSKWGATINYSDRVPSETGLIAAFLAECEGRANMFHLWDVRRPSPRLGNFTEATQLMPAGDAENTSTNPWSTGANGTVVNTGAFWRYQLNSGFTSGTFRQNIGPLGASSGAYAITGYYAPGQLNGGQGLLRVGSTDGGSEILADQTLGAEPLRFIRMFENPGSGDVWPAFGLQMSAADRHVFYGRLTLSRCGKISGASQTGSRIEVSALPISVSELASAGDMVEIATGATTNTSTLHVLTRSIITGTSGFADMYISPPLQSAPADESPIIFYRPSAKMRLTDQTNTRSDTAPIFSGFTIDAIEAHP